MSRWILAASTLLFLFPRPGIAQSEIVVDYVILVDVSRSMTGWQGSTVIFPQVKERLKERIQQLDADQTIFIQPFADGLRPGRRFQVRSSADRERAIAFVDSLQADGSNTHIYSSLLSTFEDYSLFRGGQKNRVAAVFVYTDGLDNGREGRTMSQIVEQFRLKRQKYDHLYYATLGARLPESDRAALDTVPFATYDETPKGVVHDYVVIEPRYPSLDFGNLLQAPDQRMEQRFRVRGSLPPGFKLGLSTAFPEMRLQNGPAAEVNPDSLVPTGPVQLGLEMVNARVLRPQRYEGYIQFHSPEPWVVVIPSSITAYFAYEPRRYVQLMYEGRRPPPLRLGQLDPFRSRDRRDSAAARLPVKYDDITRRDGGYFRVRVEQHPDNPGVLPARAVRLNGVPGLEHRVDAAAARQLEMAVRLGADSVRPGRYQGVLVLEPGNIAVAGPDTIAWRLEVAERPWPVAAVAGLWVLGLGLLVGGLFYVRPQLRGRMVVDSPGPQYGRSIFLGGDTRLFLGRDATPVEPDEACLSFKATGSRWNSRVAVSAGTEATLTRPSGPMDVPFDSEVLEEGDVVRIGSLRLRYTEH